MDHFSSNIRDGKTHVTIEGIAKIDTAVQIQQCFLEAYQTMYPVVINIDKTTECDSTFIQLTASLCTSLLQRGHTLSFETTDTSNPVLEAVRTLGLHRRCNCIRSHTASCPFSAAADDPPPTPEQVQ